VDLGSCQAALDRALEAAARAGLDVAAARDASRRIAERSGFPGDLYVLALAGGTGVGKSSLLNALAGAEVSQAGVRRPTTSEPIAWVPSNRLDAARPLIEWLGGATVRERAGDTSAPVAILDLPDLDSIDPAHAARVDAVLPRIDGVLWITDPEKYHDAVLHDVYLRQWMRRLDRQALVINKVDRLGDRDAERVQADLRARLSREGLPAVPVLLTSAVGDVAPLRAWLDEGTEAKQVVSGRLAAEARMEAMALAQAAGIDVADEPSPLVPDSRREAAVTNAQQKVLEVVDLPGLGRQAVAATRLAAAPRGGGPLGVLRSIVERGSGVRERRADPEGYLRRWRDRGGLSGAVQPLREVVAEALPTLPAPARPGLAPLVDTDAVARRLSDAIDRAIAGEAGRFTPPVSAVWPVLGIGQLVATAAVVLGIVWLASLYVIGGAVPTGVVDVPVLGPVPTPVVLLFGGIVAWFLLGRLLRWHAGWLGRRWSRRVGDEISAEVSAAVGTTALRPLDAYEAARLDLWRAARDALRECGGTPAPTPTLP
jgi:GTP-binding protein EngB required for normal cell division